jgi:hypothetical protein
MEAPLIVIIIDECKEERHRWQECCLCVCCMLPVSVTCGSVPGALSTESTVCGTLKL